jgi:uncharacterized protein (UPF0261 family)
LVPLNGWSSVDAPGNPTHDPEEDRIFIDVLSTKLNPDIQIIEVEANMEDPEFAKAVIESALEIF